MCDYCCWWCVSLCIAAMSASAGERTIGKRRRGPKLSVPILSNGGDAIIAWMAGWMADWMAGLAYNF